MNSTSWDLSIAPALGDILIMFSVSAVADSSIVISIYGLFCPAVATERFSNLLDGTALPDISMPYIAASGMLSEVPSPLAIHLGKDLWFTEPPE